MCGIWETELVEESLTDCFVNRSMIVLRQVGSDVQLGHRWQYLQEYDARVCVKVVFLLFHLGIIIDDMRSVNRSECQGLSERTTFLF